MLTWVSYRFLQMCITGFVISIQHTVQLHWNGLVSYSTIFPFVFILFVNFFMRVTLYVEQDFVPIAPAPKRKQLVLTEHQQDIRKQKWFVYTL